MFAPRIAAEDARGDRRTLEMMLKRVTYWNVSLSIPVFALLLLCPGRCSRCSAPRYETGATALAILAAGQLFNAATGPLGQVINMSGRPYVTMLNNAAVAALNIVGCLILIPRYGITGAACSTTAAITLVNLIKLVQVRLLFGDQPVPRRTRRALWRPASWPSPSSRRSRCSSRGRARSCRSSSRLLLVPIYVLFFWRGATGDEERELLRARPRGRTGAVREADRTPTAASSPLLRRRLVRPTHDRRRCCRRRRARALAGSATGGSTVVQVDRTWTCTAKVDLDLVKVTMTPRPRATAGTRTRCTCSRAAPGGSGGSRSCSRGRRGQGRGAACTT